MFKITITNYPVHFNKASAANLKASHNLESVNTEGKKWGTMKEYTFTRVLKSRPLKAEYRLLQNTT